MSNVSSYSSGHSVKVMPLWVATMYPKKYACWWSNDAKVEGISLYIIDPIWRYRSALQKGGLFEKYFCVCRINSDTSHLIMTSCQND